MESTLSRKTRGKIPACVRVCPAKALRFGPVDEVLGSNEARAAASLARAVRAGRERR